MGFAASRTAATLAGASGTGGSGSGTGVLAGGTDTITITGPVAQGELVTLHEGGFIRRTNPLVPVAVSNNNTPGPVQIIQAGIPTTVAASGAVLSRRPDLNFNLMSGGACAIYSPVGGLIGACAPQGALQTVAVPTGGFVSITGTTAAVAGTPNYTLTAQFYSAAGQAVGSLITLLSNYTGPYGAYNATAAVIALTNGSAVVTWSTSNGDGSIVTTGTQLINSAGTVGSPLSGTSPSPGSPAIGLANGDYLYLSGSGGVSRYSGTTGAKVWGPTTASSAAFSAFMVTQGFRELSGGNIIVLGAGSGGYGALTLLNSSGAVIGTVPFTPSMGTGGQGTCTVVPTPLGFAVVSYSAASASLALTQFDASGNLVLATQAFGPSVAQGVSTVAAVWTGAGFAAATAKQLVVCDGAGNVQGTPITLTGVGSQASNLSLAGGEDGIVMLSGTSGTVGSLAPYKCARSAIEGVAQAAATDGTSVLIASQGYFPLPASQRFLVGATFDTRTNQVPGSAGTIGTSGAWLKGWQANT